MIIITGGQNGKKTKDNGKGPDNGKAEGHSKAENNKTGNSRAEDPVKVKEAQGAPAA